MPPPFTVKKRRQVFHVGILSMRSFQGRLNGNKPWIATGHSPFILGYDPVREFYIDNTAIGRVSFAILGVKNPN